METGKKIFYLSPDTGKESGNISTPIPVAARVPDPAFLALVIDAV